MIRISELIKQLEELKEKHGDVPVLMCEEGCGGYAMFICGGAKETSLVGYDLGENGYPNDETIKFLFPKWDGNEDTIDDLEEVVCVELNSGEMLYST